MRDERNVRNSFKKRNYIFLFINFIILSTLFVRLLYVQLTEGPTLEVSANKQYYNEVDTNNLKFKLLDRKGESLLESKKKYYIIIDPITFYTLNEEDCFIKMKNISYILRNYNKKYDISVLQAEMDKGRVSYEIDEETYNKLLNIKDIKGVYVYEYDEYNTKLDWNIKNILIHSFNYKDNSKLKDEGTLEREIYEYTKENVSDKLRIEEDVSKNIIDRKSVKNEKNRDVVTTLDKNIQNKIEEVLKKEDYKNYEQVGAVLMECSTGEILAMAQKDDSISNVNIGIPSGNGFLLGSTFKTIVYETALENNLIPRNEEFKLQYIFPNSIEKLYTYNMQDAYIASSNDTFAQIGWKVGLDKIYGMASSQGMFEKVLNLEDERVGEIEGYGKLSNADIITNTSIGQTVRSTALESLTIPTTIVNDGIYVRPRILKNIVESTNKVVKEYTTEKREVLSIDNARTIKQGMISVVEDELGTGYNAKIENLQVGGKTGTTEYLDMGKKCSDGWFAGFFKYNDKYYSMIVFIPQSNEVQGESKIACTVFKDIVKNLIDKKLIP